MRLIQLKKDTLVSIKANMRLDHTSFKGSDECNSIYRRFFSCKPSVNFKRDSIFLYVSWAESSELDLLGK